MCTMASCDRENVDAGKAEGPLVSKAGKIYVFTRIEKKQGRLFVSETSDDGSRSSKAANISRGKRIRYILFDAVLSPIIEKSRISVCLYQPPVTF